MLSITHEASGTSGMINYLLRSKGIAVTTQMADYLQVLMIYTEETIACIEETLSLLLTWEAEMEIKEQQELYN